MANQPKKYKKFVATAATATLVASAIVPVASAASFTDVPADNEFAKYIDALTEAGIINGYTSTNTFKPSATLTRGQVVKMLGRWVESKGVEVPSDWNTKQRFNDVPTDHKDQELVKYAALVAEEGVFGGAAGKLMATNNITRQQMAKVLNGAYAAVNGVSLVELAEGVENVNIPDLANAGAEYEDAIQALMNLEVSSTSSGNFRPTENVTRAQFSKFLYNTINLDPAIVSPFEVKAINATTVEVTFEEPVTDLAALNFAIEGLTISNKVVKQTNAKTVVLTTSVQEGGKEYTVKVNDEEVGKFTGIAAVIPTAIKVTTPSVQGTIGKDVTVTAEVTVPEGQSKAGIPVTFNIANNTNNQLNEKIEVVAYTNEAGVASYTYTRYYKYNDNVAAYASDKSSVVAYGTVYWAESLSLKEVTTGNTFANGSKKVYEITGAPGETFNIAFKENVQVDPSKLVRTVEIKDVNIRTLNSNGTLSGTTALYPYEVTTGGIQVAYITLDREGKATFTVEGSNATVTPVVFKDGYLDTVNAKWTGNGKLDAQELQASVAPVTFSLQHTLALDVEAKGSANAAADTSNTVSNIDDANSGGRTYEVTVRTTEGKLAPATTPAYVTFEEGTLSPDKVVYINGQRAVEGQVYKIEVKGTEGKASFRLTGAKDAFAQPTVFLDNGTSTGAVKLDKADLKVVSAQTFFVDAVVKTATLKATAEGITKENKVVVGIPTTFTYQSTDQNGFPYYEGNNYNVTFQLSTTFGNLTGVLVNGQALGTTRSVTVGTTNGAATITVYSDRASDINVTASANERTLPILTTSVEYVAGLAALTAVNNADDAEDVLAALKLDDTFRAKLLSLPVANQEAIAVEIYNGLPAVNGYSEAGLRAAFNREYATQEAAVQSTAITALNTKASTAVLTVADLETVPGLDLTELKSLPGSNQTTVLAAIDAALTSDAATDIDALQTVVDTAVTAEKQAIGNAAIQAKIDAVIAATTVAEFKTALDALNDSSINAFLTTYDYASFDNQQKAEVYTTFVGEGLVAGATLTELQLAVKDALIAGEAHTTVPTTISSVVLDGTDLIITFSAATQYADTDTPAVADLGLTFDLPTTIASDVDVTVSGTGKVITIDLASSSTPSTVTVGTDITGIAVKDVFGDALDLTDAAANTEVVAAPVAP